MNSFVQIVLWLCFSFLLGKDLSMELSRLTNWQTPSQVLVQGYAANDNLSEFHELHNLTI